VSGEARRLSVMVNNESGDERLIALLIGRIVGKSYSNLQTDWRQSWR